MITEHQLTPNENLLVVTWLTVLHEVSLSICFWDREGL